jgi:hypothetical protein
MGGAAATGAEEAEAAFMAAAVAIMGAADLMAASAPMADEVTVAAAHTGAGRGA